MDAHEEALYPWLRGENAVLEQLLELEARVLGICLGAQLLAKAAQGIVEPAPEPTRRRRPGTPPALIAAETRRRIDDWNAFGRTLCRKFLDIAASAHA